MTTVFIVSAALLLANVTLCRLQGVLRPDWIFDFGAIYIVCLFISYASPLILFSSLFPSYLLPYLSFPLRTDPLCFPAGCCKRRLNLALVFLCLLRVVLHFFWSANVCFRVSCLVFSVPRREIGMVKRLRNDLFCVEWDVKPQLSNNQSAVCTVSVALLLANVIG